MVVASPSIIVGNGFLTLLLGLERRCALRHKSNFILVQVHVAAVAEIDFGVFVLLTWLLVLVVVIIGARIFLGMLIVGGVGEQLLLLNEIGQQTRRPIIYFRRRRLR